MNVFGILKVLSATTNTLVAIPWTWYSAQERNATHIPANKLVKPTNLTDGDMLYSHVEDGEGLGHYAAWILENGRWTAITTVAQGADGIGSVVRVGDDSVCVPRGFIRKYSATSWQMDPASEPSPGKKFSWTNASLSTS